MKNFAFLLLFAALSAGFFTSCDEDDMNISPEATTIVDVASSNPEFSILVEALVRANLVSALDDEAAALTVFAPTNAAFNQLFIDLGVSSVNEIDVATLTNVLLFHVVNGVAKSTDLADGYVKTLNSGGPGGTAPSLRVDLSSGVKLNGNATVTQADIMADNGVVHVINAVMLPPNVVDLALSNSIFSNLVAALTRDGSTYTDILSGDGPFTVFAPTDAAFQALLDSNPAWSSLADIPSATLDAVLQYHVVNGANVKSTDLTDEQSVTTFGGGTFTIDLTGGAQIKTTGGQTVNIVVTDVQGTNGIVHVVDQVLLP